MNSSGKVTETHASGNPTSTGPSSISVSVAKGEQARHRSPAKPNYQLSKTLTGHMGGVVSVKFSQDGSLLASASADKTAKVWDPHEGKLLHTLSGHSKGLSDTAWDPTGNYLATASDDTTLRLWNAATGLGLRTLVGHTHHVFCCAFSPNGNFLVSGSFDETIRLWDTTHGKCLKEIPAHSDPVTSVDFNRDGTLIASSSYEGLCRIWDTMSGACLKTITDSKFPPIALVKFTPNGKFILTATLDSQLKLWDYVTSSQKKLYKGHVNTKHCTFAAFSTTDRKGRWIVSGSEDHCIYIWGLNDKQVVQKLEGRASADAEGDGHYAPVLGISCHPKKSMIASSALADDCSIKIWVDNTGDQTK